MARSTGAQPRSAETAARTWPRSTLVSSAGMRSVVAGGERVGLVLADLGAQQQVRVGDRSPHGSGDAKGDQARGAVDGRHHAGRGAEAGDAAKRGRRPAAAAVVRAGGERHLAQRERHGRAARGPSAGLGGIEGIAGGPVHAVGGVGAGTELGRICLGQDHSACLADIGDGSRITGRNLFLVEQRAQGGAQAGGRLQVLDAYWQAGEQARVLAAPEGLLDLSGALARGAGIHRDDGVNGAVGRLDAGEAAVQQLDRRELALAPSGAAPPRPKDRKALSSIVSSVVVARFGAPDIAARGTSETSTAWLRLSDRG